MGAVGYLFPGQGTQRPGMGSWLHATSSGVRDVYKHASDVLGYDVFKVCQSADAGFLRDTKNAQPAIFTTNAAAAVFVSERGIQPSAVAGHSVGEFSAYWVSGSIEFADCLRLVQQRADLMDSLRDRGGMLAVLGVGRAEVDALCEDARHFGQACISVENTFRDFVCSGSEEALEYLARHAGAIKAARTVRLRTSHAFHSPLMESLERDWAALVNEAPMKDAKIPVAVNTTGHLETDVAIIKRAAIGQLAQPVLWKDCVKALLDLGLSTLIEVGDSKTLSSFTRILAPETNMISLPSTGGKRKLEAFASQMS